MADEDRSEFREALGTNTRLMTVVERSPELGVNDLYITGGAVFQTVWNYVTGRHPTTGIADYDIFYYDPDDLSQEAEDRVAAAAADLLRDLDIRVDIKNQARVHLWYESRFGSPRGKLTSTADAIDHFVATTCCHGIRPGATGYDLYAPHGFSDCLTVVLRPNPLSAARAIYEAKAAKWVAVWPQLVVLPWSSSM